jgi:hypothetical protein
MINTLCYLTAIAAMWCVLPIVLMIGLVEGRKFLRENEDDFI